jgi:hypothetical protein
MGEKDLIAQEDPQDEPTLRHNRVELRGVMQSHRCRLVRSLAAGMRLEVCAGNRLPGYRNPFDSDHEVYVDYYRRRQLAFFAFTLPSYKRRTAGSENRSQSDGSQTTQKENKHPH